MAKIRFSSPATIKIFDTLGHLLFENAYPEKGLGELEWNHKSGVYFCQLHRGREVRMKKFILFR
ncbi:MAG: T9SS type A sorting domain-containing protein [candidate division WOR-3 bacterium]|nr:T9SS type A sorting domain-containing protein [candidate division WOR-3 bacterium]